MDRFAALADPTRRAIIELLAPASRRASDVAAHFDMSAPAVSQHLKVLYNAGLVRVEKRGRERIYSLDPAALDEFAVWVERTKAMWSRRLDALEAALRREDGDEGRTGDPA